MTLNKLGELREFVEHLRDRNRNVSQTDLDKLAELTDDATDEINTVLAKYEPGNVSGGGDPATDQQPGAVENQE